MTSELRVSLYPLTVGYAIVVPLGNLVFQISSRGAAGLLPGIGWTFSFAATGFAGLFVVFTTDYTGCRRTY